MQGQGDRPRAGRPRPHNPDTDGTAVATAIRRAFLNHMSEQQASWGGHGPSKAPSARSAAKGKAPAQR